MLNAVSRPAHYIRPMPTLQFPQYWVAVDPKRSSPVDLRMSSAQIRLAACAEALPQISFNFNRWNRGAQSLGITRTDGSFVPTTLAPSPLWSRSIAPDRCIK